MSSRLQNGLAPIIAGLIAAWAAAALVTLRTTIANDYLSHGFYKSALFTFKQDLSRFVIPIMACFVFLSLVAWIWDRWRGGGIRLFIGLLGLTAGLSFFVRVGYLENRFRFSHYWKALKREFAGLELPDALFRWDVWRTNLLITLGAVGIGLAVWFLLRLVVGRERSGRGRWRALGHPAVAATVACVFLLSSIIPSLLRGDDEGRPNFILVSIDTLRADHLGVYGYERDTSPQLDSLAAESCLFEWPISQSPTTPVSHISILTSLYPTVHGVTGEADCLAPWRLTLTEHLRESGYRTVAYTDGGFMRGWYGYSQGFERYEDRQKGVAKVVELGLAALDAGLAASPFFLFLHCYDVHSPYDSPPPLGQMFVDPDYDGDFFPSVGALEAIRRKVRFNPGQGHGLSPDDIAFMTARYDGGIRYTDYWMGVLARGLAERGILDNTWLIITSDHGEELTEHGSVMHETLYHTVTQVPLIVRPPGPSRPGRRIEEIVELIDIMPTILELAAVTPACDMQGASLVPLLTGNDDGWKNVAYSEFHRSGAPRSTTTPELHVITSLSSGEIEAFDYRNDPLEQRSLHDDGANPEAVAGTFHALWDWHLEQARIAQEQRPGTKSLIIDAEAEAELRALGYIQ